METSLAGMVWRSGNGVGFTSRGGEDAFTATLDTNSFTHNSSGVFIEDAGIGLKNNIAQENSEWGSYAPNSIDLGGNRASGMATHRSVSGVAR